jgi:hypothetical protein
VVGPPVLLALTSRWIREADAEDNPPASLPPARHARRESSETARETKGRQARNRLTMVASG